MKAIPLWVALVLAACSSEAPRTLSGDKAGAPTTGGDPAGPSAAEVHEARVKQLLAKVGPDALGALSKWRAAPIIEAEVDVSGDRFDARWRYTWVNGPEPLSAIAFEVPANVGKSQAAPVVLEGVEVDGVAVAASGTTQRWEVPLKVAAGAKVDLLLRFSGTAPRFEESAAGVDRETALEAAAELGRLVPTVPVIDARAAFGRRGATLVLAGCMPRAIGMPAALIDLAVTGDQGLEIDGNGEPTDRGRKDGRVTQRAMLVGVHDVAIVLSQGLASVTAEGDASLTWRGAPASPAKVFADARRARDDMRTRWGAGSEVLTLVSVEGLEGVAAVGGLVMVPAALVDGGGEPPAPGTRLKSPILRTLGGFLAHHPAQDEALSYALTVAIAEGWWQGRGADSAADVVLRHGFARAAALEVIARKGGDKAERRALELALRVPVQLALQKGASDVVLAQTSGGEIAALKAGLFVETLARHLGAPVLAGLEAKLRALGVVSLEAFRAEVLAVAPRPEEAKALLARWLDETHLNEDVGPLRPEVLLEYLVTDGAIGGLSSHLMDQLAPGGLGGRALELLGEGHELDAGLALSLLGEMAGADADPAMKKWLTLGTKLLGDGPDKQAAIEGLVEELGAELGIPEADRSRLRQLSKTLLEALRDDMKNAPSPEPAPDP